MGPETRVTQRGKEHNWGGKYESQRLHHAEVDLFRGDDAEFPSSFGKRGDGGRGAWVSLLIVPPPLKGPDKNERGEKPRGPRRQPSSIYILRATAVGALQLAPGARCEGRRRARAFHRRARPTPISAARCGRSLSAAEARARPRGRVSWRHGPRAFAAARPRPAPAVQSARR